MPWSMKLSVFTGLRQGGLKGTWAMSKQNVVGHVSSHDLSKDEKQKQVKEKILLDLTLCDKLKCVLGEKGCVWR